MIETANNTNLRDYIVVELSSGELGKCRLEGLDRLFLPISDTGEVAALEEEIYDLSAYLTTLSVDFAENNQSIDELDKLFEKKSDTDYMPKDPNILKEDRINEMVNNAKLVTVDEVDSTYEAVVDDLDLEFDKVNNKMGNWFNT